MKIIWNPNPLRTVIECDENDLQLIHDKIMIEEQRNYIYNLQWQLKEDTKRYNPNSVLKDLKEFDHKNLQKQVDDLTIQAAEDLKQIHVGDCTCIPCSCMKCFAEDYLGVNTIKGLGKHEASNIISAFGGYGEPGKDDPFTIDEALENLQNYKVESFEDNEAWKGSGFTKEYYDIWIPEWEAQHRRAYKWLLNYKKEHFNE